MVINTAKYDKEKYKPQQPATVTWSESTILD